MRRSKRKKSNDSDQKQDMPVLPETRNTGIKAPEGKTREKGTPSRTQKSTAMQQAATNTKMSERQQQSRTATTTQKPKQSKMKPSIHNTDGRAEAASGTPLLPQTFPSSPSFFNRDQPLRLPLGRNMPAKMPLLDAIHLARHLGYQALQLFLSNPDTWHAPLLAPPLAVAVVQALAEAHFSSVVIHAPFLIDLSSERESAWIQSILLLRSTLDQARLIGASDVVVHLNNYKRSFASVSDRHIERIVKAIPHVLSDGPSTPLSSIRLLLENGCNLRASPGSRVEVLGTILRALPPAYQQQVGICLDTAHCWAAGYDLSTHIESFLHLVESTIGFSRIHLLHLNDAKHDLGSAKDEHAQWGTGQISQRGVSGIRMLLQDVRLAHTTLIMETPLQKKEDGQFDWEQEKLHQDIITRLLLKTQESF